MRLTRGIPGAGKVAWVCVRQYHTLLPGKGVVYSPVGEMYLRVSTHVAVRQRWAGVGWRSMVPAMRMITW